MKQLAALLALTIFPTAALAAVPTLGIRQIVTYILVAIGIAIIVGGLVFLIRRAPLIPGRHQAMDRMVALPAGDHCHHLRRLVTDRGIG